jgi:hypothetical protein
LLILQFEMWNDFLSLPVLHCEHIVKGHIYFLVWRNFGRHLIG